MGRTQGKVKNKPRARRQAKNLSLGSMDPYPDFGESYYFQEKDVGRLEMSHAKERIQYE